MSKAKDTKKTAGAVLRGGGSDPEAAREAARVLGSRTSERKKQTSAANGRLAPPGPGRPPRPLSDFPCTCGRGDDLEGHPTTCPRGAAIRRRQKAGQIPV